MPHLSETPPPRCSSCNLQRPDMAHVDFEAAWDGPVIEDGIIGVDGEKTHTLRTSIDELVICEECLTVGGRLVGLEPVDADRVVALEEQLDAARTAVLELQELTKEQDRALRARDAFGEAQTAKRRARAAA